MSNRSSMVSLLLLPILVAMASSVAAAQCDTTAGGSIRIAGRVVDARALTPVRARVLITTGNDTLSALDADSSGFFVTTLCRRTAVVANFRRSGYRPDSLALSLEVLLDTLHWTPLDVAMTPLTQTPALSLASARVATPATIAARTRRGGGLYIGREEIERVNATRTSELLRGRRGITLESSGNGPRVVSTRSGRPREAGGSTADVAANSEIPLRPTNEACPLRIGVDGYLMAEDFRIDELEPGDLLAIEIYPSATSMPLEFTAVRRSKVCGLVMFWSSSSKAPSS
ncbi:MAG: hypothetical protein ABIV10_01715 [Gemmatimonadaceae bacterium]